MKMKGSPLIQKIYFPVEVQEWIDVLLEPLNDVITSHHTALSGNLTFGENIKAEVKSLEFVNGIESDSIKHSQTQYLGVIMLSSPDKVVYFSDKIVDNSNIKITAKFDSVPRGTIKFVVLGV